MQSSILWGKSCLWEVDFNTWILGFSIGTSKTVPDINKTTAGNLPSKYIIHAYLSNADKVKKITHEILKLAEKEGMKSVSFPALGTGNIGGSPHQVAPALIDAIGEFATNEKPKSLQLVKLVIFQADMIPVFEDTLKTKSGDSFKKPEGAWKRGINMVGAVLKYATGSGAGPGKKDDAEHDIRKKKPKEEQDVLILLIVARDASKIDKAVKRIEEYIQDEYYSEEVVPVEGEDSVLEDGMMGAIRIIGKKHKVRISTGKKGIIVEGPKAAVLGTKADIISEFARIQGEEKRRAKELLLSKEVQWRYKSDTGIYDDYDEEINARLEKAYQNKEASIELDMEEGKIQIDLVKMVEIDVTGNEVQINRADLSIEKSNLPSNWIPMDESSNLEVVKLTQGSPEYNDVEQSFKAGYPNANIVQIDRIQNKEIYTQYTARKEQMKARLGMETERLLYHGTSQDTVDKINMRGFNRSYCGKNAVVFGKGTYFARDLSYSAQDRYSQRDANNQKYIYICKVQIPIETTEPSDEDQDDDIDIDSISDDESEYEDDSDDDGD
ncbi:protein mono-ADP-ribosyltransferase PARP14-like [Amphiura filiformis]|uniref:protein mono-ADP-ribosyltransferase PARP14-like n=1 Tax=Amphiura filiformis TaxID=82378 RepID=UPI003B217EA8